MKALFGIGAANERLAASLEETAEHLKKRSLIFTSKRVFVAALNAARSYFQKLQKEPGGTS